MNNLKGNKDSHIFFHRCMRKYQSLPYQHIRARELFSNPFYKGICIPLARPFPTAPAQRSIHLANTPFWKTCKHREPLKFKWKIVYGILEWKLFARFLRTAFTLTGFVHFFFFIFPLHRWFRIVTFGKPAKAIKASTQGKIGLSRNSGWLKQIQTQETICEHLHLLNMFPTGFLILWHFFRSG